MASAGPEPISPEGEAARGALLARSGVLLLANRQTTEGARLAVERLSVTLERPTKLRARWGDLTLYNQDAAASVEVKPVGIDIGWVAAVEAVVCAGVLSPAAALERLDAIGRAPAVSLARFAPITAAGAAALSVIFGADDVRTVVLVSVVAGPAHACAGPRRGSSGNPLLQPVVASLLAGLAAGLAVRAGLPVMYPLLAVCPCMVLVPGPHFLNGMIDLVRSRNPLGAARLTLASLIVLVICTGLLAGPALARASFPEAGAVDPVPLTIDVLAGEVAVAAPAALGRAVFAWRPARPHAPTV